MNKYQLAMNGQNFLIAVDGKPAKRGFFQYFYIEASSPKEAEMVAVDKIRNNDELKAATLNPKDDPPTINLDELEELESFEGVEEMETGRIWYIEKAWWQFWK